MAKIIIRHEGITVTASIEAPAGHVWNATQTHELVSSVYHGNGATAHVRADIKARMAMGYDVCPDRPNCDWCDDL